MDAAITLVNDFNEVYTEYPGPDTLVGDKSVFNTKFKKKQELRARHAATVGAHEMSATEEETIFSVALASKNPVELQWAVMTALAIDESVREAVAAECPPEAAKLARNLPVMLERYLMGAPPNVMIKTPFEAVCDFTLKVEQTFTQVRECSQ